MELLGTVRPTDEAARATWLQIFAVIHATKRSGAGSEIRPAFLKAKYTGRTRSCCRSAFSSPSAALSRNDFPTPRLPFRTTGAPSFSCSIILLSAGASTKQESNFSEVRSSARIERSFVNSALRQSAGREACVPTASVRSYFQAYLLNGHRRRAVILLRIGNTAHIIRRFRRSSLLRPNQVARLPRMRKSRE